MVLVSRFDSDWVTCNRPLPQHLAAYHLVMQSNTASAVLGVFASAGKMAAAGSTVYVVTDYVCS